MTTLAAQMRFTALDPRIGASSASFPLNLLDEPLLEARLGWESVFTHVDINEPAWAMSSPSKHDAQEPTDDALRNLVKFLKLGRHVTLPRAAEASRRPRAESPPKRVYDIPRQEPTVDHYHEAVRELKLVRDEAVEDGWPVPNDVAVDNATKLLDLMHEHFPQRYHVYPSHNGGVCLEPPGGKRSSFLVICEADGKILCSADRPRRPWQVRFPEFDRARGSGLILKALHDNRLGLSVP